MEPSLEIISYTYILQRTAYVVQQIQCFRFQGETFDSLGSNFVLMHVKIQFSWHHLLNMLFFSVYIFLASWSYVRRLQLRVILFGSSIYFIGLHICFCADTILSSLLWLYNISCSLKWQFLQCSYILLRQIWLSKSFLVPYTFQIFFVFCEESFRYFVWDCVKSVHCFWQDNHSAIVYLLGVESWSLSQKTSHTQDI